MPTQVVYTALFGEHEKLLEQPAATQSRARFICFTDDSSLSSSSWEIVHVKPLFPTDPRRSQRDIKIRGHELLAPFDQWLYIDNTVLLKAPPEDIVDQWLESADWAAFAHDAHQTTWEEFEANLAANKDTPERLNEQLHDYSTHYPEALDARPLWNGFFARRNSETVAEFASLWFHHVCRYSARDQLSIMVALSERPLTVNAISGSTRHSPWHTWPHREGETPESKATRHAKNTGLKPLADELEASRLENATLRGELQRAQDARWLGLGGLWRRVNELRRARRRAKKQARKRR